MRKRVVGSNAVVEAPAAEGWLALDQLASVEVTSESSEFPIEGALVLADGSPGWRAAAPGEQTIRLIFDEPCSIRRIQLTFVEAEQERTQEFTLRWGALTGEKREIVRQQWCFSPQGSTRQVEDYQVNLEGVGVLELDLKPDLRPDQAVATLAAWRVG